MTETTFYLAQAAICADAASKATLANERDKFLAAEKAWHALAQGPKARAAAWAGSVPAKPR